MKKIVYIILSLIFIVFILVGISNIAPKVEMKNDQLEEVK